MEHKLTLKANAPQSHSGAGRYLLIMSTGAAAQVEIGIYLGTQEIERVYTARRGFRARIVDGFTRVEFKAPVDTTLQFVVSNGQVDIDLFDGASIETTIVNPLPLPVDLDRGGDPATPIYVSGLLLSDTPASALNDNAAVAVGAVAVLLVAANPARKALRFRNIGTDPAAIGGAGITWAKRCDVIEADDAWVEDDAANLAWYAICDAGSAASITVQEVIAA